MAVSYPDAIGEYIDHPERYYTGGLQYAGYFEPAQIAPEQTTHLYLFIQNVFNAPIKTQLAIQVPQSGGFLRGKKEILEVETDQIKLELADGEAGLLTIPVTTTDDADAGEYSLTVEVKTQAQKGAKRARPDQFTSKLDNTFIDSPVGLNLAGSLGTTYTENAVKKASFDLTIAGEPAPPERAPKTNYTYEQIWTKEQLRFFNEAVKELNSREVKLKNELEVESLYANFFGESTLRFADAGLPLRIGEAIVLAKILTYTCQYFLSSQARRNGLLVPIWEQALAADMNTTDSLDVIRGVGYHHVLRLSVAASFGLIAKTLKKQFWPLQERQIVANHIADSIDAGQNLDPEFLYLPLLMAGTQICGKLKLKGEDVGHTLALIKKARDARTDLFLDDDMAQADKIYSRILKQALQ